MSTSAVDFAIGFFVSLGSSVMNALGLNLLKLDHVRNSAKTEAEQRNECGRPLWHIGLYLYILSQVIGSTIALNYLKTQWVAPLGSIALIFNFVFARILVGTHITRRDVIGTLIVICAVVWIVVFGGMNGGSDPGDQLDLATLKQLYLNSVFIIYFTILNILIFTLFVLAVYATWIVSDATQRRQSKSRIFRDTPPKKLKKAVGILTAIVGGMFASETLLLAKSGKGTRKLTLGISVELFVNSISSGVSQFTDGISYFILAALVLTAILQVYCLNMGLKWYTSVVVVPLFYGTYTALGLINTMIYLNELGSYPAWALCLVLVGIIGLIYGVKLLSAAKPEPTSTTQPATAEPADQEMTDLERTTEEPMDAESSVDTDDKKARVHRAGEPEDEDEDLVFVRQESTDSLPPIRQHPSNLSMTSNPSQGSADGSRSRLAGSSLSLTSLLRRPHNPSWLTRLMPKSKKQDSSNEPSTVLNVSQPSIPLDYGMDQMELAHTEERDDMRYQKGYEEGMFDSKGVGEIPVYRSPHRIRVTYSPLTYIISISLIFLYAHALITNPHPNTFAIIFLLLNLSFHSLCLITHWFELVNMERNVVAFGTWGLWIGWSVGVTVFPTKMPSPSPNYVTTLLFWAFMAERRNAWGIMAWEWLNSLEELDNIWRDRRRRGIIWGEHEAEIEREMRAEEERQRRREEEARRREAGDTTDAAQTDMDDDHFAQNYSFFGTLNEDKSFRAHTNTASFSPTASIPSSSASSTASSPVSSTPTTPPSSGTNTPMELTIQKFGVILRRHRNRFVTSLLTYRVFAYRIWCMLGIGSIWGILYALSTTFDRVRQLTSALEGNGHPDFASILSTTSLLLNPPKPGEDWPDYTLITDFFHPLPLLKIWMMNVVAGRWMLIWYSFWTFQYRAVVWKREGREGIVVWFADDGAWGTELY
ncbi:hypothetical protein BZG36_01793 [Bifiguratus adelaidae]|uniref:Uncharacterized protein n=1 Tax=Bifiguratus adelaidae TaxID=1938954 RepID=A0A261Y2B1_9FUNG|nr:hypothetical protein BZG36_01793 [Bifiguratus adelaidae]